MTHLKFFEKHAWRNHATTEVWTVLWKNTRHMYYYSNDVI